MFEHEFYADPTVFDQWQNNTGNWFGSGLEKLSPFSWALGFCALGATFLLVAMGVFIDSLLHSSAGATVEMWNQTLAQWVTFILALTASAGLFKQAIKSWPRQFGLSDGFGALTACGGWRKSRRAALSNASSTSQTPQMLATDRQAVQEFFSGVRAAGVNVTIAKALFAAGVRTTQHLSRTEDSDLYAIHGVGPATVRKLRAHFTQH